jgi:HNH endonuclease
VRTSSGEMGINACYARRELELHHLMPVARGGSNSENNLITLCNRCHTYIERKYAVGLDILDVMIRIVSDKDIIDNPKKSSRLIGVSVKVYDRLKAIKTRSFKTIERLQDHYEEKN